MAMTDAERKAALVKVEKAIADRGGEFQKLLPKGWTVDRFAAQARVALAKTPKLLETDPKSVVLALYQCAELGLVPGGGLGHGWLVPYGKAAQWVTGYKGLIYLATKAKVVKSVRSVCVYQHEKDAGKFIHKEGQNRMLEHEVLPSPDGKEPVLIAAYITMLLDDGQRDFHVMYLHQLLKRRDRSSGYQNAIQYKKSHPWISDFDAMCMKTVVRDGLKNAPMSSEAEWGERLGRAFEREDTEIEDAIVDDPDDAEEKPAKGGMAGLSRALGEGQQAETLEFSSPREKVLAEAAARAEEGPQSGG